MFDCTHKADSVTISQASMSIRSRGQGKKFGIRNFKVKSLSQRCKHVDFTYCEKPDKYVWSCFHNPPGKGKLSESVANNTVYTHIHKNQYLTFDFYCLFCSTQ